jgi:hypothetical protein
VNKMYCSCVYVCRAVGCRAAAGGSGERVEGAQNEGHGRCTATTAAAIRASQLLLLRVHFQQRP